MRTLTLCHVCETMFAFVDSIGRQKCLNCFRVARHRPNKIIRISDEASAIVLSNGREAIVDAADVSMLISIRWWFLNSRSDKAYVSCHHPDTGPTLLHRFIMGAEVGQCIDHINGDGLDNRRCNLRIATISQNQQNRRRSLDNTSGFKGVHHREDSDRWRARIVVNGKRLHLGNFDTAAQAGEAYAEAAKKYFGEFARVL